MTQPRYSKEHQQQAKESQAAMFTLDLDRKYTICSNAGGRVTVQGVASPEQYKYLRLAYFVLQGFSPQKARRLAGFSA